MKKKSKPKAPPKRLVILNVKMTPEDFKRLSMLAKKHADGNLSAWVRHAGLTYTPKKANEVPPKSYRLTRT